MLVGVQIPFPAPILTKKQKNMKKLNEEHPVIQFGFLILIFALAYVSAWLFC